MITDWSLPEVSGESMPCATRPRFVRALDASNFAEQRSAILKDDHHAVLPGDKQTVIGRIGHDVVPASVPAQR